MLRKAAIAILAILLLTLVPLAVSEGVYSIVKWRKAHRSITYQLSLMAGLAHTPGSNKNAAYAPHFSDPRELGDLVPLLEENEVGIGNAPFDVRSEAAAINTTVGGCLSVKPNLRKTAFFLHSSPFDRLDSVTVFYDADKKLDPRLEEFFARYAGPKLAISSNADGERLTIPGVTAEPVTLVAGDSVAFGAMIDDRETIASQLQARTTARRYVNLGVGGAQSESIICRLEDAARRYKGRISELIYVYCENDMDPSEPYGTPKQVMAWLKPFAEREKIGKVTVVFAPYVYMVVPELTRIEGTRGETFPSREGERAELKALVEEAGFRWADIGTLAREEEYRQKSHLAILSFFVDRTHLSPLGTKRLVDYLLGAD